MSEVLVAVPAARPQADGGRTGTSDRVCNPAWVQAEQQVRSWVAQHALVAGEEEVRRLARMGHGRMAGWLAPGASTAELGLLAQWGAFIALVDDGFDRHGRSPARARAVLELLGVLEDADGSRYPGSAVPAVRALADLWGRSRVAARPGWRQRFLASYRDFADATVTELRLRASGEQLGLEEYVVLRRRMITVLPVLAVVERSLPVADGLEGLREATADIVAWTNDLRSAPREQEEGTENLVGVLARHHPCSRSGAAAHARAMLAERLADFDQAAAHGERAAVIRRVRDGCLAWQRETHRNPAGGGDATDPHEAGLPALAQHLAVAVDAAGHVEDRCGSRVLESALLLALLCKLGAEPGEQDRLTRFLERRRAGADAVDALLIDACLDPAGTAFHVSDRMAGLSLSFGSRTGGRGRLKSVMLKTVLHLLCGSPLDDSDVPSPAGPQGITTFTDVHVLSAQIIHAHACGRPGLAGDAERSRLVSLLSQGDNRVLWEASATTHLLGLHAVRTFRPDDRVVQDGVLRLCLAVNADGGVPFLDSQDLWLTAVAGLAFTREQTLAPYVTRMADLVALWQAPDGAGRSPPACGRPTSTPAPAVWSSSTPPTPTDTALRWSEPMGT
ncbi:hypothetical protein [Streptomyces sp. NPDC004250]|uniref:terpene synthase family protein n=1 Tax=Streptomyces sp. NPDC004250 TaxID=3364692 RepID=UPI0036B08E65